jgi:hypothetical protein
MPSTSVFQCVTFRSQDVVSHPGMYRPPSRRGRSKRRSWCSTGRTTACADTGATPTSAGPTSSLHLKSRCDYSKAPLVSLNRSTPLLASKAKLSESREFYRRRSKALPNLFTGIGWCSVLLKRLRGQRPANRKYCHGFRFLRNFWAHCAHFENWDIVPPWPLQH